MLVRIAAGLACLLAAFAAAGCGNQRGGGATPIACREGIAAYLRALRAAPGRVRLGGETPISECLTENQQEGDLATVGEAMVDAATKLDARGRAQGGGRAAVELGYLLGAARRGADSTEGVHSELIRRLTVAASFSPAGQLPPSFLAAYRRGYDAGRAHG